MSTILGYQIRSRHALLKMLTGTKKEEDQSFDNINTLLITSTSMIVLSCVMEVLMYFLYNNKVYQNTEYKTKIIMLHLILQFHPRKEIVAEPEEASKKNSYQGKQI